MFYINGGSRGKKHTLREIFTAVDEKEDQDDNDSKQRSHARSRSRSRSRSRATTRSENDSDSDRSDDDIETDEESVKSGSEKYTDEQNQDYIVALGTSVKDNPIHYQYSFVDNELDYDIEEFAEKHPEIKIFELMIYRINTVSTLPFLEFL